MVEFCHFAICYIALAFRDEIMLMLYDVLMFRTFMSCVYYVLYVNFRC